MRQINLDVDVLRGFATGMDVGSYAKAATLLGRSTSAVSAQLKKLEEQAGTPLFRRSGRGLALTEAGETMLAYARRMVALNDEATAAVRGVELEGWVRFGLQEDFSELLLPEVLGRFARAHPKVRIEARVARNAELLEQFEAGNLDIALAWAEGALARGGELIAELPMRWIGPANGPLPWTPGGSEPLPLIAFEGNCVFRNRPTAELDRTGIAWRLAFTSPSLSGLWAATAAGLGLTVRSTIALPSRVRMISPGEADLPALPHVGLSLHRSKRNMGPAATRFGEIVLEAVRAAATASEAAAALQVK
ncbi:MAG TPA: LysR substrate-binding domain-containing protein [Devosiaceae bacterium]